MYTGYRLAGGDDFAALSLVKQSDPTGAYFPAHRRRGRRGVNASFDDYYWTPDHTGYDDANRGVPYTAANDLLTNSSSRVLMKTRLATAGEKALAWTTTSGYGPSRQQSSAAFHSAGYQGVKWPCIVEAKVRIPLSSAGANGMWPAFWLENMLPPWPNTGEWDFEWKNTTDLYNNFITGNSGGDTNDSISGTVVATMNDGIDHIVGLVATATTLKFYVDGTLVATASRRPTDIVNGPMFWWLRHGVGNWNGMSYDPSLWTGKTPTMEVDWVRIWTQPASTDIGYKGIVQTINVAFASSFSVTLPSETALWGTTGLTEWLVIQPFEDNAPGMSQVPTTTNYGDWYGQTPGSNYAGPTICTWNRATRTFTGGSFDRAGRMYAHLIAWDDTNGGLAGVARVVVNVGPHITLSSQTWTQGTSMSLDVYAACDAGTLVTDGTSKTKTFVVTGLPAGLSYDDSTGLITGTPTATGTGNFSVTATNSIGQTVASSVAYTVATGNHAVAAPALTGAPTLLASWDFGDNTKVSSTSGSIDSVSGSDSTSVTLANTGTNRPTTANVSGMPCASFASASSQFLQVANALGTPAAVSVVVIFKPTTSAASATLVDIANGAGTTNTSRHWTLLSTTTGYNHRKMDNSSTSSQANSGTSYDTALHLMVGISPSGASGAAQLYLDGVGTPVTAGTPSGQPSGFTHVTVGAARASGAQSVFLNGAVFRVLVYGAALNATQAEQIAVWATTNYGTTNAA